MRVLRFSSTVISIFLKNINIIMGTLLYILLLWSILSYFETIPLLNDYQFIVKNRQKLFIYLKTEKYNI